MKYISKYTGEEIDTILGQAEKQEPLNKENVESILTGNVITHSHDTILEKPVCDVLNIATLEADMQALVGDGSTFPLAGEGTESNPYVIDSALKWVLFQAEVLNNTSSESKRFFSLIVNCDLAGLEIPVEASSVSADTKIQYSINGNGHFIRNFTLTGKNTLVAPFPILGSYDANNPTGITSPHEKIDADIRNIGFKDAIYKLRCDSELGTTYAAVAGIAGLVMNTTGHYPGRCPIENCYLDNIQLNVDNSYSNSETGALIVVSSLFGVNMIGNIKDCYAKGIKVRVNSVSNSKIGYCPFADSLWAFDYFLFENLYTEATIEANQEVIQTFPSIANVIFNNCFFCSNYISSTIPEGVTAITLDAIKTIELSTVLGKQFGFDRNKNDGYPFLVGQEIENLIYDGYVRKSELGNQSGNSSDDVFKIPASISELTSSSTSEQIANAIGGINGFHAIQDAIRTLKRIIFYMEADGMIQWGDVGIKASGTGEISEGVQGEIVLLGASEGSVSTTYIIIYNPSNRTFSIQVQR